MGMITFPFRGRPNDELIVCPNGCPEFGFVGIEAGNHGRHAGPIYLLVGNLGFGATHIHEKRIDQIVRMGYSGVAEFVYDIAANYTHVHDGEDGRLRLILPSFKSTVPGTSSRLDRCLVVQPDYRGSSWNCVTAFDMRPEKKKGQLLWRRSEPVAGSGQAVPTSELAASSISSDGQTGESNRTGDQREANPSQPIIDQTRVPVKAKKRVAVPCVACGTDLRLVQIGPCPYCGHVPPN
jgi:hypothetical protein